MIPGVPTISSTCQIGTCVEVTWLLSGAVQVRSTVTGERVTFLSSEWAPFLAGVKAGEFDLQDTA